MEIKHTLCLAARMELKMMASDLDWLLDADGELLPHAYLVTPPYINHDRGDHNYARTGEPRESGKENAPNKGKGKANLSVRKPIAKKRKLSLI